MGLSRSSIRTREAASHSLRLLQWVMVHLLLAGITAASILGVGLSGMFVAMAPRIISEAVEPFSLLLLPGLFFAIASVGPHDFKPNTVVRAAAVFWFVVAFGFFIWRARSLRP